MTVRLPESAAPDFLSQAATPLAVLDPDARVARLNDAWKPFVADPGRAVGAPFSAVIHHADRAIADAVFARLAPGASEAFEVRLGASRDSAVERSIRLSATRAADRRIYVVGIVAEESRRARADDAHRLALFDAFLASAPVAMFGLDGDGMFTAWEGKLAGRMGGERSDVIGRSFMDHWRDSEVFPHVMRALAGHEHSAPASFQGSVHCEVWYQPVRGADGEPRGMVGFGLDVTRQRQTEADLRDNLAILEKTERELRDKLDLVARQNTTIRALATPIIQVWDDVLCLPIIGTVDSARTAAMMQGLLDAIVGKQARYAIVDLTGVEVVDTATAGHLIRLFRAAKLLGADGIICGIRPAVAQAVVALGVDLGSVKTMRSLRDALKWCIHARDGARANTSSGSPAPPGAGRAGA